MEFGLDAEAHRLAGDELNEARQHAGRHEADRHDVEIDRQNCIRSPAATLLPARSLARAGTPFAGILKE